MKQRSINRTDYDYMDNLNLDGWAWEMLRRSTKYRNGSKELVELIRRYNASKRRRNCEEIFDDIERSIWSLYATTGISIYLDMKQDPETYITQNLCNGLPWKYGIPKPEIRYCDFDIELRPSIRGLSPVRVSTFDQINSIVNYPFPGKWPPHSIIALISPHLREKPIKDTIYVGISRYAGLEEVLKTLIPQLKQYLKNSNRRTLDKWKYYLIAYDLKEANPSITYENIANILRDAYPDVRDKKGNEITFVARNSRNFYNKARGLIEGEDLKKQLQKHL